MLIWETIGGLGALGGIVKIGQIATKLQKSRNQKLEQINHDKIMCTALEALENYREHRCPVIGETSTKNSCTSLLKASNNYNFWLTVDKQINEIIISCIPTMYNEIFTNIIPFPKKVKKFIKIQCEYVRKLHRMKRTDNVAIKKKFGAMIVTFQYIWGCECPQIKKDIPCVQIDIYIGKIISHFFRKFFKEFNFIVVTNR